MNADQVGLALHGVVQAKLGKVAVAGVHIVQVDVFHGQSDHLLGGDVLLRQQEQSAVAHEVLHVVYTEHGLHGDLLIAQVIVSVDDVGKAHHLGHVLVETGKLVQHLSFCHRKSALPGLFRYLERAGAEEGVEIGQHLVLKRHEESLVGLLYGDVSAVLRHALDGHALGILGNVDVAIGNRLHLHLGEGDLVTLSHGAALETAVHAGLVGNQLRAGSLADRTHNAHDVAQCVPVVSKAGHEIHLTGGSGKLGRSCYVSFRSHK